MATTTERPEQCTRTVCDEDFVALDDVSCGARERLEEAVGRELARRLVTALSSELWAPRSRSFEP
jgi:hypothetical protein